jgi:hypothetical protein
MSHDRIFDGLCGGLLSWWRLQSLKFRRAIFSAKRPQLYHITSVLTAKIHNSALGQGRELSDVTFTVIPLIFQYLMLP